MCRPRRVGPPRVSRSWSRTVGGLCLEPLVLFVMLLPRFWIIRRLLLITFFLMADAIFNFGIGPCTGFHLQSQGNSSAETGLDDPLDEYFNSVLNDSRALEEAIYSDILDNLRSLLREENAPQRSSFNETAGRHKTRKFGCESANRTEPAAALGSDIFLGGTGRFEDKKDGKSAFRGPKDDEYLLGYSGSPFGGRRPVTGVVEMPESEGGSFQQGLADPRRKRSVVHLYNMVLCTTGCNPLAYKGYGCYCGFLGSGFVVDGIDSCCKMHDWCYNSAGCPMFFEYFIPYLWKCYHRQPLCAIDHGSYGGPGSCAQRLCECDRQLALCLRRFPCPSTKALCTSSPWRLLQNILML